MGWKIEYERDTCIGAGPCVAANGEEWSIAEDGKATLAKSTFDKTRNVWILEVNDEAQLEKHKNAANECPVNAIHIIDPSGHKQI